MASEPPISLRLASSSGVISFTSTFVAPMVSAVLAMILAFAPSLPSSC
ncbi:Uncharacterised protein [Vibrio cholerae]|nr:Uncharacterised protein [Vibrio cholerae]CSH85703.1 Uncharacterised protein [Vibrio cholerae]